MSFLANPYSGGTPFKISLHNHQDPDTGSASPEYRGNQGDDGDLDSSVVGARAETAGLDAVAMTSHEFMEDDSDIETATSVTWIPSVEIHDFFGDAEGSEARSIHVAGINVPLLSWPLPLDAPGNRVTAQDIIDNFISEGAATILAHPNIDFYSSSENGYTDNTDPYDLKGQYYITQAEIDALTDWHGMEVYTSTPSLYYGVDGAYADGSNGSINKIDPTLANYGFFTIVAVSDFHRDTLQAQFVDQTGGDKSTTIDGGFTVIFAASLTPENVATAIKTGNAYATQGPLLASAPSVDVGTVSIESDDSCTCQWIGDDGVVLQTDAAGTSFSFIATTQGYIRATLTRVSDGLKIWTQAMFVDTNLMQTDIESTPTEVYSVFNGKVFSQDGIDYYRGVNGGDAVSVDPVGLTAYS